MSLRRNLLRAGCLAAALLGPLAASAQASPSGANDWSCRPTPVHPRPVVLVHATFVNMDLNWAVVSPLLRREGYCVFAFNYGATNPQLPGVGGLAPVAESGQVMRAFVDRVREATGSEKVDLVGHSQGGMLLKYFISGLGGGAHVHQAVAMAPTIHGTTLSGLATLGTAFPALAGPVKSSAPGAWDQSTGSDFMRALNALPDTAGGAKLTVISTIYDMVVTPVGSQRPTGPGTKWILLQNQCGLDFVDHVGMALDSIAHRNILNELDPSSARPIRCKVIAPIVGG